MSKPKTFNVGTKVLVKDQSMGIIENIRVNVLGLGSVEYLIAPLGMKKRWYLAEEVRENV